MLYVTFCLARTFLVCSTCDVLLVTQCYSAVCGPKDFTLPKPVVKLIVVITRPIWHWCEEKHTTLY